MERPLIAGWQCRVCGASVDIAVPFTWKCPNATETDRHHALRLVQTESPPRLAPAANPFLINRSLLAWDAFAAANAMTVPAREAMVSELDSQVAAVDGVGFVATPFGRADELSDTLGFGHDGGVWVKDETRSVAGSHKARHLFTILLHVVAAERLGLTLWTDEASRPPLAIASYQPLTSGSAMNSGFWAFISLIVPMPSL